MNIPSKIIAFILGLFVVGSLCAIPWIAEDVDAGEYHILQSAGSGKLTAQMQPGMYGQWFGTIYKMPVSETFFFTKDNEGGVGDASIGIQFSDGSHCKIAGTCRVDYPKLDKEAIDLIRVHGFRTHEQVEDKLILPVVRRSLVMAANFITAKESYAEKRAEFISNAWDQIENGVFVTKDELVVENDLITGQKINRVKKVKVVDAKTGQIMRERNPLAGLGISLSNFEIKEFIYEEKVRAQISAQQTAMMDVQTARSNAQKAEQDALTTEARGKADVMKARYEEEQKKIRAVVEAEKDKEVANMQAKKEAEVANTIAKKEAEVAIINAQKLVDVALKEKEQAVIKLQIAELDKKALLEKATGESEYKRQVFAADGGLLPKLEAFKEINAHWAKAYETRKVPSITMGNDGNNGNDDVNNFMKMLMINQAKQLALDTEIKETIPKK